MAHLIPKSARQSKDLVSRDEKWIRGLNLLVSNTQIRPDELSEAQDVELVEDGKVQCPRTGQAYYGSSSGSRVHGIFAYNQADGTRQLLRMNDSGKLQLYASGSWNNVSGYTYTTGLNTDAVTAYDRLYLCNGTDPLTYYDGSSITSFTSLTAPTAPTVTRTGTTGSYTYSYKITAVSNVGETSASAEGHSDLNQAVLDASSYMTVSWSAVTGAIGYNVYGRKDGQWSFITYLEGNSSTSYIDKGSVTPSTVFTPPEGNSTAGPKGKYVSLYKDSLFVFGDPDNPSRLYYSGGGDKINDFTIGGGGGFIDISKNDGQIGTGMIVFKNSLVVFKEDSIYQFSFDSSGLPSVVLVNPSVGAIAPRSIIAVENDVFFMSRRGVFTLGNEAGFAFDVLRTNELSSRVRSVVTSIDPAHVANVAAIYVSDSTKNLAIFAYTPSGSTTNSKAIVYDRERLGFVKWSNIQANCWCTWRGSDSVTHYLYGDDASGYVKEILSGSDDFGTPIRGYFRVRAEAFKELDRYKRLKDVTVVLRRPSGTIKLNLIQDGVNTVYTNQIGTLQPSINFGHYVFSRFLFGQSSGTGVSSQDENVKRVIRNINLTGRSFMLEFDNQGTSASFTLLLTMLLARPRSLRYSKSEEVVTT